MSSSPPPGARFRALVVEDEWPARNYLVELLENSRRAQVIAAVGSIEEAAQALAPESGLAIDVAFVDVNIAQSGSEAGLDLVRGFVGRPTAPNFVLATAFKQHALDAYELGVVDYLVKPFTEERVARSLERLGERRAAPTPPASASRIVARHGKSLVFLEPAEVLAFEASERLTFVHTLAGRFDVDLSLANMEATVGPKFVRVHRSWLVQLSHVRELGRDANDTWVFVGNGLGNERRGLVVPVARERASALRDTLLDGATGVRRG